MPKMKSHSGAAKRFKKTPSGRSKEVNLIEAIYSPRRALKEKDI